MSLRLVFEEYVGLMREAGELDMFVPQLLSAMDHQIVFKPQTGIRQYGVDIVSRGPTEDGRTALHIWVLKCGDIDRDVWGVGRQSIRHSLEEIADVYLRSHVLPEDKALPKIVWVLTNGDLKQELTLEVSSYLEKWSARDPIETGVVNGSRLASWAEKFLLNEFALPEAYQSLFRKALATVETPEVSYEHGRTLIKQLLDHAILDTGSGRAKQKRLLTGLRTCLMVNGVIRLWARDAGNLEAAFLLSEYSVLATWSFLCKYEYLENAAAAEAFQLLMVHYVSTAEWYHSKLEPYYLTQSALASVYSDHTLVVERVFDEIGRLGALATAFRLMEAAHESFRENARGLAAMLAALIESHSISGSPCFDRQSTDVSLGLLGLLAGERYDEAERWLLTLVDRLGFAKQLKKFAPISSDSFEDLVAVRYGHEEATEFQATSTVLLTMGLWCSILTAGGWRMLTERVVPLFAGTTLNAWSPDQDYDAALGDETALKSSGFTEAFLSLPATYEELENMLGTSLPEVPGIDAFQFSKYGMEWIGLLASRHWRAQLPNRLVVLLAKRFLLDRQTSGGPDSGTLQAGVPDR
ncbi:MAG: hypothetical protein JWO04_5419 [Gammaproteobacteria bacterium]|nr:hypothetical protein [Gammaproteobacteria bacterium]